MRSDGYILKNGKKLRLGYTTGACAAAACKAAAMMLLSGEPVHTIKLTIPAGIILNLEVLDICFEQNRVSCGILKDGGDDPDITNGLIIYGQITLTEEPEIQIKAGVGVGIVTKSGLNQPIGAPAINSTPQQMIKEALTLVCQKYHYQKGLLATISVPDGEQIALKTFNPRLGILGGISILGTTGLVEPMSDKAIIDTIEIELKQKVCQQQKILIITPGNYGADFITNHLGFDADLSVKCSNFIGDTLDLASAFGFESVLLIGHIGKLVKLAGGIMNTHSRYGDCRSEIFITHGALSGADSATLRAINQSTTTQDMIAALKAAGCFPETMNRILEKIHFHINHRCHGNLKVGAILFSNDAELLGFTTHAKELLNEFKQEMKL